MISEQTLVNRRVVLEIIRQSGRGKEMLRNPQAFIEQLTEVIKNNCYQLDIDGIRYQRLAGEDYYVQEIFETEELMANLDRNAIEVSKSVYDYVVYDSSTIEKPFAVALDNAPDRPPGSHQGHPLSSFLYWHFCNEKDHSGGYHGAAKHWFRYRLQPQ